MAKKSNQNQPQQPQQPLNLSQEQVEEVEEDRDQSNTNPANEPVYMTLTKEALIELLREARRDPKLEASLDKEAARVATRRSQMVKIAKADERAKAMRQKACQHKKPDGTETSGGQEFSDGRVRIFCLRCQKVLRSYWSPAMAQGMAMQARMDALGITEAELEAAMQVEGQGSPLDDQADDFALARPRGVHLPDLTTETV